MFLFTILFVCLNHHYRFLLWMLWTNELVIAALSHKLLSVLYRYTLIALAYSLTSQVVSLAISVYSGLVASSDVYDTISLCIEEAGDRLFQ